MSLALVAILVAIGVGAVVAVSTRESAVAPIGLAVALVAAALLADPLPSATILGVRIMAALLAATLIRWAGRSGPRGAARQPSPLGWPSEALLATAGTIAGVGVAVGLASIGLAFPGGGPVDGPVDGPILGPGLGVPTGEAAVTAMALTVGAAACLFVLGAAPTVHGRPGIRRAIGLVLLAQAVILLRLGIAGPAPVLEEVAWAGLLVACAATGAALARAASEVHELTESPAADARGRGLAHR
jgi:hypothetical protein